MKKKVAIKFSIFSPQNPSFLLYYRQKFTFFLPPDDKKTKQCKICNTTKSSDSKILKTAQTFGLTL